MRRSPAPIVVFATTAAVLCAGTGARPASARPFPRHRPVIASEPEGGLSPTSTRAHALASAHGPRPMAPRRVSAAAGLLVDDVTGGSLWERSADRRRSIGSIVKVMTALIVIANGGLERPIAIVKRDRRCVRFGGTNAGLHPGETLTARELLPAMLVPSGCDAAHALARAYGPGTRPFVDTMNATAARLGLTATRFTNPDGMPQPREGYSTARDVVALGRVAMRNPLLRSIVAQPESRVPRTAGHRAHRWRNTNELLGRYPGMIGIKTGYTNAAGGCVLFAATRVNATLIGVVLGSPVRSRFVMVARVLDWAFGG